MASRDVLSQQQQQQQQQQHQHRLTHYDPPPPPPPASASSAGATALPPGERDGLLKSSPRYSSLQSAKIPVIKEEEVVTAEHQPQHPHQQCQQQQDQQQQQHEPRLGIKNQAQSNLLLSSLFQPPPLVQLGQHQQPLTPRSCIKNQVPNNNSALLSSLFEPPQRPSSSSFLEEEEKIPLIQQQRRLRNIRTCDSNTTATRPKEKNNLTNRTAASRSMDDANIENININSDNNNNNNDNSNDLGLVNELRYNMGAGGRRIAFVLYILITLYTAIIIIGPILLLLQDKHLWCPVANDNHSHITRHRVGDHIDESVYDNPDYIIDPCRYYRSPQLFFLTLEDCDISRRMLTAVVLGGAIGYERRSADRPAGIRTMGLVSLGACFYTVSSIMAFKSSTMGWDSSRVTAALPSGVGFLGGALIWKGSINFNNEGQEKHQVHGLTTAASLWLSAAIGVGAGGALYAVTIYATALVIIMLRYGPKLYSYTYDEFEDDDDEEENVAVTAAEGAEAEIVVTKEKEEQRLVRKTLVSTEEGEPNNLPSTSASSSFMAMFLPPRVGAGGRLSEERRAASSTSLFPAAAAATSAEPFLQDRTYKLNQQRRTLSESVLVTFYQQQQQQQTNTTNRNSNKKNNDDDDDNNLPHKNQSWHGGVARRRRLSQAKLNEIPTFGS